MLTPVLVSSLLIAATTLVHGVSIALGAALLRPFCGRVPAAIRFTRDVFVLVALGLWLMVAHYLGIWAWAFAYTQLGVHTDIETAFYFASLCYTTLGLGGIEIASQWYLLPGATAANGFLHFGMSAAFMMETFSRLRLSRT